MDRWVTPCDIPPLVTPIEPVHVAPNVARDTPYLRRGNARRIPIASLRSLLSPAADTRHVAARQIANVSKLLELMSVRVVLRIKANGQVEHGQVEH